MSSKNMGFIADLAAGVEPQEKAADRSVRLGAGVLSGRNSRLADLATGSIVDNPQQLVDPQRCRIWERHNRDYAALTPERCKDLIESIIAQGKQEVPAIVRRISGDPDYDFEVICGARRHWTISWLRANNYPEMRYLVEIRNLTDEQAFRISDLENRAREDLSDVERARDYLRALDLYYGGKQKNMASRLNQSEAWLSRYLDLARLPEDLLQAFSDPHELRISHVGTLKPILKPADMRAKVLDEAGRLARARAAGEPVPNSTPDILRALVSAANRAAVAVRTAPKKTGKAPDLIRSGAGTPIARIDRKDKKSVTLTLLLKEGGTRVEAEAVLKELLNLHWPR